MTVAPGAKLSSVTRGSDVDAFGCDGSDKGNAISDASSVTVAVCYRSCPLAVAEHPWTAVPRSS